MRFFLTSPLLVTLFASSLVAASNDNFNTDTSSFSFRQYYSPSDTKLENKDLKTCGTLLATFVAQYASNNMSLDLYYGPVKGDRQKLFSLVEKTEKLIDRPGVFSGSPGLVKYWKMINHNTYYKAFSIPSKYYKSGALVNDDLKSRKPSDKAYYLKMSGDSGHGLVVRWSDPFVVGKSKKSC